MQCRASAAVYCGVVKRSVHLMLCRVSRVGRGSVSQCSAAWNILYKARHLMHVVSCYSHLVTLCDQVVHGHDQVI